MSKVALAYSGSLDTTLCVHWLKEHHNLEVIAVAVDVGISADLVSLGDRAIRAGAVSAEIIDLREEFSRHYILPALKAQLQGSNGDPYANALGRPTICKALVESAWEHGCRVVAHGCKPGTDDQIRFENEIHALDSKLELITPIKEWHLKSHDQKLKYARTHNLPLDFTSEESEWSLDGNLWGLATLIEELDDTWASAPASSCRLTTPLIETPNKPTSLIIEFKQGVPIALDNQRFSLLEIIQKINQIGAENGIGHLDVIHHRLNGKKARKIIECPGSTILLKAHRAVEEITLDRESLKFQEEASNQYQRLVLQGLWFSHLRESLDKFFETTQRYVTGEVRLELFRGSVRIVGRRSNYSLYKDDWNQGPSGRWLRPLSNKNPNQRH